MHTPGTRSAAPTIRAQALSAGLLSLLCACASSATLPREPEAAFEALEARLTRAGTLSCVSRLSAEGAVEAELECRHELARDGRARVSVRGTFAGRPVDLELSSDGDGLTVHTPDGPRGLPPATHLYDGFVYGLTRMGWLHDVALLSTGGGPDGTEGDAQTLARVVDLAAGEDLELGGRRRRALTFGVEVEGQRAATAVLWVDVATGLPLERWQRVHFPEGEMRVVELYEHIALDGPLALDAP